MTLGGLLAFVIVCEIATRIGFIQKKIYIGAESNGEGATEPEPCYLI